jgi:hypothetical protein
MEQILYGQGFVGGFCSEPGLEGSPLFYNAGHFQLGTFLAICANEPLSKSKHVSDNYIY